MHDSPATATLPAEFRPERYVTDSLPADFLPDPVMAQAVPPGLSLAALGYARPYARGRVGESGFGVVSCALFGVTLIYTLVCAAGLTGATGWVVLGWLVVGLVGNWVGCGVGFLFGIVGVVQSRHGRRWAIHGMWLNGVLAVAPVVVFAVLSPK